MFHWEDGAYKLYSILYTLYNSNNSLIYVLCCYEDIVVSFVFDKMDKGHKFKSQLACELWHLNISIIRSETWTHIQ